MKFGTIIFLSTLLLVAGCDATFNPLGSLGSSRSAPSPSVTPVERTAVGESDLAPIGNQNAFQSAERTAATVSDAATLPGRWILADQRSLATCPIVITGESVSGTGWKRANAGGSCFNQLYLVTGWTLKGGNIRFHNSKNEVMATLQKSTNNQYVGKTTSGLAISLSR